mmetsp:Transcript_21716/g.73047  ORF Transcript_21716/g.73047 Transcript_21716/m.73047 type:complete len:368 (-) Transcript_21716:148-1251(-)
MWAWLRRAATRLAAYSLSTAAVLRVMGGPQLATTAGAGVCAAPSVAANASDGALTAARLLTPPDVVASHDGEYEGADFWLEHEGLLRRAWDEFGVQDPAVRAWDDGQLAPGLREAVVAAHAARGAGGTEEAVKAQWTEVAPEVFVGQLLSPEAVGRLRAELDRLSASEVPTRRPNGMNRYGLLLTEPGAGPDLRPWLAGLVGRAARPVASALFPAHLGPGDADETYAFTVRYAAGGDWPGGDRALAEHRDASVATVNVNVDRPGEGREGSALTFVPLDGEGEPATVRFTPGMAVVHLGARRHCAEPIAAGTRTNLVVWLHGEGGYVRCAKYAAHERLAPEERWGGAGAAGARPAEASKGASALAAYG